MLDFAILVIGGIFLATSLGWIALALILREKIRLMDEYVLGRRVSGDNEFSMLYRAVDYAFISTSTWCARRVHPDVDLKNAPRELTIWFRIIFALLMITVLTGTIGFTLLRLREP